MGCNCKNKVDAINEKYGDGGKDNGRTNPLFKIIEFIMRIGVGILCGLIIIIMLVPMLIYIIFCLMFGKEATFRIRDFSKYFKKE